MKNKHSNRLFAILGVFAVGMGRESKNGVLVDRLVIRVQLDINHGLQLADSIDKVSQELEGCSVQVIESERPQEVGAADTYHSPLQGGIEIGVN